MRRRGAVGGILLLSLALGGFSAGMTLAADPAPQAAEAAAETPKKKSFWDKLRLRGKKTETEAAPAAAPAGQAAAPAGQATAPAGQAAAPAKTSAPASSTAAPANASAPKPVAAATVTTAAAVEKKPAPKSPMPSSLAKTQARMQKSPLAADPASKALLDAVESPSVTGDQVNQLAVLLGRRGAYRDAIAYQDWAVKLTPNDPSYWINLGTLHRALDEQSAAGSAYKRALEIDPNNGAAHYNLGAVYERQGDYDNAVDQYRIALILDPKLADPKVNPQVVNNERLMVVQLLNYSRQAGSTSLPLMGAPPVAAPPAPAKAPTAAPAAPPKTPVPAPAQAPPAGQRPPATGTTQETKK